MSFAAEIAALERAVKGGAIAGVLWVANDNASEGDKNVYMTGAKAAATTGAEPGMHMMFGRQPVVGTGAMVDVGDKVTALFYGDRGCISGVLRVYKDVAAAAAGLARVE